MQVYNSKYLQVGFFFSFKMPINNSFDNSSQRKKTGVKHFCLDETLEKKKTNLTPHVPLPNDRENSDLCGSTGSRKKKKKKSYSLKKSSEFRNI